MRTNRRRKRHSHTHMHAEDTYIDIHMVTGKQHKQLSTAPKEAHTKIVTSSNHAGHAPKDVTRTRMETEMTYFLSTRACSHMLTHDTAQNKILSLLHLKNKN